MNACKPETRSGIIASAFFLHHHHVLSATSVRLISCKCFPGRSLSVTKIALQNSGYDQPPQPNLGGQPGGFVVATYFYALASTIRANIPAQMPVPQVPGMQQQNIADRVRRSL